MKYSKELLCNIQKDAKNHLCELQVELASITQPLQMTALFWHSPKHGSVTSVSLTLPVPALQVHILGVPPAEVLLVGQAAHTPEVGWTYSFTSQTAGMVQFIDISYLDVY